MSTMVLSLVALCAAAPPVKTSTTAETMLYIRTTPSGAEVLLDGQPLGASPGLFKVPHGVRRVVVELDGHEPGGDEITIKAGHILRLQFKLKRRSGPAAEDATESVANFLNLFQAAVNQFDSEKLEALFLPPDDTPAGEARRKHLDESKEQWPEMKAAGVTAEYRLVGIEEKQDGKDRIVSATMVGQLTSAAGEVEKGERPIQFRITPTKDGWKIVEMTTDGGEHAQGPPTMTPETPSAASADSVSKLVRQFAAAMNELDFKKLEALFLPPDDTPAGEARRKHLDEARKDWSRAKLAGAAMDMRVVRMAIRSEGEDKIADVVMAGRAAGAKGSEEVELPIQLRVTPTPSGWKIAEMTTDGRGRRDAKPQPESPARTSAESVAEILKRFETALNEGDSERLEALFLPPDDTLAGMTRRKDLEDARREFSRRNANRRMREVQFIQWNVKSDGKGKLVEATIVARTPEPDGQADLREATLLLRLASTPSGWKIAEITAIGLPSEETVEDGGGIGRLLPFQLLRPYPVAEVLKQFQAAVNESDFDKLEALFLPPDDTPAGKARRKHLDDARGEFADPARRRRTRNVKAVVRVHGMSERADGEDIVFRAETVAQEKLPNGQTETTVRTYRFRIRPTGDGWKIVDLDPIAEMKLDPRSTPDENLQRRRVGKKVSDFPEAVDLSTPESACAAYHRASARMDAKAVVDLSWGTMKGRVTLNGEPVEGATVEFQPAAKERSPSSGQTNADGRYELVKIDPAELERFWAGVEPENLALYIQAQRDAEIVEVWTYRGRLANVISRLAFPLGSRQPRYSSRSFGLIDGQWKSLSLRETGCDSPETAVGGFIQEKERLWDQLRKVEGGLSGPVQIEKLEGPDVLVIRGREGDVEKVVDIIREIERSVIERTVTPTDQKSDRFLDLDTGKLFDAPDVADDAAMKVWAAEQGIDLVAEDVPVGFDMVLVPVKADVWETVPNGLIKAVAGGTGAAVTPMPIRHDRPATYVFKTREGGMGVLQIVGSIEKKPPGDPRGIRIRYKLFARGDPDKAAGDEQAVRDVVSRFVAGATQDSEAAAKIPLHTLAGPTVLGQLDNMREVVAAGLDPDEIRLVNVGRGRALVVTEFMPLEDKKYENRVCMVYTLVKREGGWMIDDIDLEDVEGLAGEIRRFDANYGRPEAAHQVWPRRAYLPDVDKRGAKGFLDLATGETFANPYTYLSDDEAGAAVARLTKGDLFYDQALGFLRGARAMLWDGKRFKALAPEGQQGRLRAYKLPTVPCRLLITTAEEKHFDVTVLSTTGDGGIHLEYRPADPSLVPKPSGPDERPPEPKPDRAGSLSFGPVIEQVLKDPEKRVAELLDLDTGDWARSTEFGSDDRKTHQWIRERKVDALGIVEGGKPGLLLFDVAVYQNPGIRWDAITPAEVVNHRWLGQTEPEPITVLATEDTAKLPLVCLFQTREGAKGVLQLVGMTEDAKAAKIRYKLVQRPAGSPSVSVRITGPQAGTVGQMAEFVVDIANTGEEALTSVRVVGELDAKLEPVQASAGFQQRAPSGVDSSPPFTWTVPSLSPKETAQFELHCRCTSAGTAWCRVTVGSDQEPQFQVEKQIEIQTAPGLSDADVGGSPKAS